MSNSIKQRIRLKPDSPECWTNPPKYPIGYYNYDIDLRDNIKSEKPVQLDADKVFQWIEDGFNIRLYDAQKEILRNYISARNEGKEIFFTFPRQSGITTVRNCIALIEALYNK